MEHIFPVNELSKAIKLHKTLWIEMAKLAEKHVFPVKHRVIRDVMGIEESVINECFICEYADNMRQTNPAAVINNTTKHINTRCKYCPIIWNPENLEKQENNSLCETDDYEYPTLYDQYVELRHEWARNKKGFDKYVEVVEICRKIADLPVRPEVNYKQ